MKLALSLLTAFCGLALSSRAATPPAEKLLPDDTLIFVTVPDWNKASAAYDGSPIVRFWNDPTMARFREKFDAKFRAEVITPLEKELGAKFSNYTNLISGQFTLAVTKNGWDGKGDQNPGVVLLMDSGEKSAQLSETILDLKKKWVASGKQMKTDKVRGVDVATLILSSDDIAKSLGSSFPMLKPAAPADGDKPSKYEISVGQSGSLLLVGNDLKLFEKILNRQSGGLAPAVGELPAYEADAHLFRDALLYSWANFKPLGEILSRQASESATTGPLGSPFAPRPDKLMEALGLGGLRTVAFSLQRSPDGLGSTVFFGIPESQQKGLFKLLAVEQKDASPTPFVPADAVKFSRLRLDGQKAWSGFEAIVAGISPSINNIVQLTLDTINAAAREKDPSFDLRRGLIGNLGDDVISFQKSPRSSRLEDLTRAPRLTLISSPNADQFAHTLKTAASLMAPLGGEPIRERDFQGRKLYSMPLPPVPAAGGQPMARSFHFSSSGGYVAMSTDIAIVEEYLRGAAASGRALRETPGINEAAQKVGGMSKGFFGYENQSETLRLMFEALKQDPTAFDKLFLLNPLGGWVPTPEDVQKRSEWFDAALLPSFDRIAKYFHFTVYGMNAGPQGITFKTFSPTPPMLR